ncbi:MAG: Ku protein [Bacillota bacterium]
MSLRSIWKGTISFGLVSIPVRLYPATGRQDLRFNLLHKKCGGRLNYRKYCPRCEEEVSQEETVRGYEYEQDRYVVIEEADFDNIAGEQTRQIELISFVRLSEIDPVHYDRTYYVVPEKLGLKPYALLAQAMGEAARVGIGRFSLRKKPHLVALRIKNDALLVETMFYHDEVRQLDAELSYDLGGADVHPKERQMAVQLIQNLSEPFRPEAYENTYRRRLMSFIQSKIEGREVTAAPAKRDEEVIDLMEALERSLEESEKAASRGGS